TASGAHAFREPFEFLRLGKTGGLSVKLFRVSDNKRFRTFRFRNSDTARMFTKTWDDLKNISAE
ncbi:MAG TPA: hypothetical protein VLL97_05805, partial [Acidobacteriota bacterium]|nr:hypothetical protein [Acidobacteriota bacterium]